MTKTLKPASFHENRLATSQLAMRRHAEAVAAKTLARLAANYYLTPRGNWLERLFGDAEAGR